MSITILIVDDEPLMRRSLMRELRGIACRILTAVDGAEALEVLSRERVDILLTDYQMPGFTGAELVRRARRLLPNLLAIVLSGAPDEAERDLGSESAPVLPKPWDRQQLRQLVEPELLEAA